MTVRKFCLGFLVVIAAAGTRAADLPGYPFVFVVGHADLDTPPDLATCSLTLHAIDPDAGKAESTVNGRLKSVLAALSAQHVAPNDIESYTVGKQILTNNEYNARGPAAIRGYDVARSLKFTVRELESLPAIESPLVAEPNIENIVCQFDRKNRKDLEADLLTKALQSAREQADKLAQPLGRRVTAAVAISRMHFDSIAGAFGQGGPGFAAETASRMFKRSVTPEALLVPATISLAATVNVLFKIE